MKAFAGVLLGIFFVVGQGLIEVGTALEKLDGPVTALVDAGKGLAKVAKKTPKATAKVILATAKAIK